MYIIVYIHFVCMSFPLDPQAHTFSIKDPLQLTNMQSITILDASFIFLPQKTAPCISTSYHKKAGKSLETTLKHWRNPESPRDNNLAIFRVDFIHGNGWCLWWTPGRRQQKIRGKPIDLKKTNRINVANPGTMVLNAPMGSVASGANSFWKGEILGEAGWMVTLPKFNTEFFPWKVTESQ